MEAQTTQVEYSTFANRPVLHCFPWGDAKRALIESDGKPYYNVFDFQPYFYCLESDPDPRGAAQIEPGFVGLDGAKLKKVVVGVPAEVPILRQQVHHREADVLFPLRYAIDRIPEIPHSPPDVLYADIEMASSKGVPDPLNPVDPITVISTYLKPQFVTFSWHPRFKQERLETGGSLLFRFTSERDLLAGYTAYVRKMWPDVWAGWNLINFDARCLYGRMLACGINPALLSPLGTAPGSRLPPFWITKDHEPVLKGTVLFDLLAAYKAFMNRDFDSLSLEATAQRELGTGKRPMDKSRMGDLWREDPERIEEYCRTDVELIVRLDRKLRLLEFFTEIHEVAGVFLGDIINWNLKKLHGAHIVETYIMRNSDRILRSHAHSGAMPELRGADPPEPTRGLFRNVIKIDDPSKYPSVMFTFNMGEDTLTDREQEPDCIRGELASFRRHEDQLGEIPRLIEQLFERKDHYHKLRNAENYGTDEWHRLDHRRYVFKQILNGFQGASSQPSSRIFHPAIANDITWAGREMFGIAYRTVSEMGYHVLGGHTDSVFFEVQTYDLEKQLAIGKAVTENVTAAYRRWAEERGVSGPWIRLRSELDGIASAGFLSRKTMYAFKMKWKGDVETGKETDEVDIAGFQTKRSDYPPILRLLQDEFLRRLLNGEDPNEIAFDVTPRIEAVAKGRCAPMDVAIPKGLQKAIGTYQNHSPWDSGAVWSNKHLTTVRFTQGSKPRLLYVKSVPKGMEPTDHICIESENDLVEGIEIDWPLMAEKIRAGFKGVITALGLNPKTFLTNQKPLEMFA